MAIRVKKKRRQASLKGEALEVLNDALDRMDPHPTRKTWKPMATSLAEQKGGGEYFAAFIEENEEKLGWEWSALWICHIVMSENGQLDFSERLYETLTETYPRDYLSEMVRGRMLRDFEAEYYVARDHLRYATELWPEGCEAFYQLGILYDLMGVPEYAFACADQAYQHADQFGENGYKLKARISYNQAVAMWQAARPYGDIKAYLRRSLDDWPAYERAQNLLNNLPEDDEADPRGRNPLQRLTDDIKKNINQPAYHVVGPDLDD